jgi:Uncharacterized protein conserved in bacteria (DUF2330)
MRTVLKPVIAVLVTGLALVGALAGPAAACGGLVAPNGAVQLLRTTTLAAHVDGVEHYITSFAFASPEESFGSIVPLPGEPTNVERAGRWTLQRLVQEVQTFEGDAAANESALFAAADRSVEVLQHEQIGALDVTIVRGGGTEVAEWAEEQGFVISEDAPELLDFYSERSPYFMAARFDADLAAADNFTEGDAIPVHLEIPTEDPWVPIRILGLDKPGGEIVQADVFLLTDQRPTLLGPNALVLERSEPASDLLLDDLRSDRRSEWVPEEAWFTYLRIDAPAGELTGDLAIDVDGTNPSPVDAGLTGGELAAGPTLLGGGSGEPWAWAVVVLASAVLVGGLFLLFGRGPRAQAGRET